jgi:DNA-binding XRE family transcriptional regulator
MINYEHLPITPDTARAARHYLGLNQLQAAQQSGLSSHKIKNFESGQYLPDTKFAGDLKGFYEGSGYQFPDTVKPGTNAKANGSVFPEGVIAPSDADSADTSVPGKPEKHTIQHMRINPSLTDDEIGNIFDHFEKNEDAISRLLAKNVETGLFGGTTDAAEAAHAQAVRLLAENGTLFAKLLGRSVVRTPSPELASGKVAPKTHADLLAFTQAPMHAAVAGDKSNAANQVCVKQPKTLNEAIFG